jgi:hypothetical protein
LILRACDLLLVLVASDPQGRGWTAVVGLETTGQTDVFRDIGHGARSDANIDAFKLFETPTGNAGLTFSLSLALVSLLVPLAAFAFGDRFFGAAAAADRGRASTPAITRSTARTPFPFASNASETPQT